jgi:hypothetical protein
MADLFQIGYGGGPPKAIDYSKALDPLAEKITTRVKESKAKTDALINNMPQGVPIDKVPEQLRGQVTDFLTKNKQAYVDASKVIASGIPSTDQRYIDAVATINQVDAKFKNLSNTFEDIALTRQAGMDAREHGKGALNWQIADHEDLANGTMYDNMIIQDDGSVNYKSNDGVVKRWADYSNTFQTSSVGSKSFYDLKANYNKAGQGGTSLDENQAREQFRGILSGLKTDGARDFMFSDREFLATKIKADFGTDEYNNELNKLVNGGNTEVLLKEFEDFKVKQLTTSNTNALNQYNNLLNLKNSGSKGQTFSWGYRSNAQLTGVANQLKDVVTKQSGKVQLPNGVEVNWDGKKKVFTSKDKEGEYEISPQKIINIFEGYYTQNDLFGNFNFSTPPSMKELIADNYPERNKI